MKTVKVAIIRQDLAELTGDATEAVVLHQFIYWTKTVRAFDHMLKEEAGRAGTHGDPVDMPYSEGWIYKSSDEMADEVMVGGRRTVARAMESLEEKGYLFTRANPKYKWDRTKQYRLNLCRLERDLLALGYTLRALDIIIDLPPIGEDGQCIGQFDQSCGQNDQSNGLCGQAIPEITTETTTETSTHSLPPAGAGSEWFGEEKVEKKKKGAAPKKYSSKDYLPNGPYSEDPHAGARGLFAYYMRRIYEVHKIDYEVAGKDITRFVSRLKSMAESMGGADGVIAYIDWFLKQDGFYKKAGYTINLMTYTDTLNQYKASKTVNMSPMAKGVATNDEERLKVKGKII